MSFPLGHGIASVEDLPLPLWLFYYGGAIVLVLSFVALAVLWPKPRLRAARDGRRLPDVLQRVLLSTVLRVVVSGAALGLLVVVWVAAIFGGPTQVDNIAPIFVFVVFWVGLVLVVLVFGNVWTVLNPWRAAADAVAWLARQAGVQGRTLPYPEWLGRWPATVLLLAFTAFELAYIEPANPRAVGLGITIYSAVTWLGMAFFGRRVWLENGEAFSVYFTLFSRLAPFGVRESEGRRELIIRLPLSGLALPEPRPGTTAFILVMLGSVAFDGFSRTQWWVEQQLDLQARYVLDQPTLADTVVTLFNLAGLFAVILVVAIAYLAAVEAARAVGRSSERLEGAFIWSLVPIALAYAVAHYFSLLLREGQLAIALISDPLGKGWDLFGTADYTVDLAIISPNTVWYVQVAALVTGHVAGLIAAHDRAVELFASARTAVRTQYAMLMLMVLYTVGGLWLLSKG